MLKRITSAKSVAIKSLVLPKLPVLVQLLVLLMRDLSMSVEVSCAEDSIDELPLWFALDVLGLGLLFKAILSLEYFSLYQCCLSA